MQPVTKTMYLQYPEKAVVVLLEQDPQNGDLVSIDSATQTVTNHVTYQTVMPQFNSVLMQNNTKQLIQTLSPEETKAAAQLMRIKIIAEDQKDKIKTLERKMLYVASPSSEGKANARAAIWSVFEETIDECEREWGELVEKHQSNANLAPFLKETIRTIYKLRKKYINSYGSSLPVGGSRVENLEYQKLKQKSTFVPIAWRSLPDTHTMMQFDFLSKEVSYEQAACYLKFLVQIGTHESDMLKAFEQVSASSPKIYTQLYFDYYPEQAPWNMTLCMTDNYKKLSPGKSIGICSEPKWAAEPIVLQWAKTGKSMSCLPLVGKEWKFVVLEGNKVVQWEKGSNRQIVEKKNQLTAIHENRLQIDLSQLKF